MFRSGSRAIRSAFIAEIASDLLARGYAVRLHAHGGSMEPCIRSGARLVIAPAARADLQTPGAVLLARHGSRLVAHRLERVDGDDSVVLRGDASRLPDPGVRPENVLGRVRVIEQPSRIELLGRALAPVWGAALGALAIAREFVPITAGAGALPAPLRTSPE